MSTSGGFTGTYGHRTVVQRKKSSTATAPKTSRPRNITQKQLASKPTTHSVFADVFGESKLDRSHLKQAPTRTRTALKKPGTAPAKTAGTLVATQGPPRTKQQRPKSQISALRKPKKFVPPSQRAGAKQLRPSLSDQLKKLGDAAGDFTSELRKKHGLEEQTGRNGVGVLKSTPSNKFTVGRLECKYPSPVTFHADCARYCFHHPFANQEIAMTMFYTDLRRPQIVGRTFRFKISHALSQFGSDYDQDNPSHFVSMEMSTGSDVEWIKRVIIPRCQGRAR